MAKKKPRPARSGRRDHVGIVREGDAVTLSVNLANVDLPSQEFEADVLWPIVRNGAVSFLLDQLSLNDPKLVHARVEVRMPFESFMQFWATTRAEPFASRFQKWMTEP